MGLPCIRYVLDGVYLCRAEPSRHNLKVSVFGQGLQSKINGMKTVNVNLHVSTKISHLSIDQELILKEV